MRSLVILNSDEYFFFVSEMAWSLGCEIRRSDPIISDLIFNMKRMDLRGYNITNFPASLELLVRDALGLKRRFFKAINYTFNEFVDLQGGLSLIQAAVHLQVAGGDRQAVSGGKGSVDALSNAFLKALEDVYPVTRTFQLIDFSNRVVQEGGGTAARVAVKTEYMNEQGERWCTVGVSENANRASWEAIVTANIYGLLREYEEEV